MSQNIFRNPFVSIAPALVNLSVGNGTLTIDRLTHFTVSQKYTVICSAIAPFTVFNVVGELDGAVGVVIVGTQFTDEDNKVFFTIQQGPTLFQIGDSFEFTVTQGVDLNQQNIDLYDELPQKNFGQGLTGQSKGNHNIRFSALPVKAFRDIQNLKFTSDVFGPDGNEVSIEYVSGSLLTPASLGLQGILFEANDAGISGNDISIEFAELDLANTATITFQNVRFDAVNPGIAGNLISIRYIGGGTQGSEVVTVVGNAITIQIQNGVTTSDDIEVAIALFPAAAALVETDGTGIGIEIQTIQGPTFLAGGTNQAGDTITVTGNAILVKFESGVTTVQQVKGYIDASVDALTLISTTITGVASNTMTNPIVATFLSGGLEQVGEPGNEVVVVIDQAIQVSFISGLSTATQIKAAIEANATAAALVDITFLGLGSTFQTSPNARTFLTGGSLSGSYAFNTDELDDPINFYEGNAPILHTGAVNQGDQLVLGETEHKGKVTLDDDILSNVSGPKVENLQKTTNNIIQNQKIFLKTNDNSKVEWSKPNLIFTADILIVLTETGYLNRVLTSASPIIVADGQHAYITLNRLANATVVVVVASTVPTGENVIRLFSRIGDDIIWYDNTLQRDNKRIGIGEGGGGGTGYQEKIGTGNGIGTTFPLTFIPSNEHSILVIASHIKANISEYSYNPIGNQIVFTTAPSAGQDVYVFYLTDGETITVPTPTGLLNSYIHTVTLSEETAKELTLLNIPSQPPKALVDIISGGTVEFNLDFTIAIQQFQWATYALDGDLVEGDKIRFYFYS